MHGSHHDSIESGDAILAGPPGLARLAAVLLAAALMSAAAAGESTASHEVAPDLAPGEALPASLVAGANLRSSIRCNPTASCTAM